ncbi:helix-turn-helix domain-containing protein [Undibacterium sp. CCC2.1]|nr:helix-turn-helix domain-containing protein [Undibacterium sp. CCC2.1]MEB0141427.1 helix-turn-helix domain-containing protein [Undibacterium sp. CCC2.1]
MVSLHKAGSSISALARTYGISRASIMRVTGGL